MKIDDQEG